MKRTFASSLLIALLALSFAVQASAEKIGYSFDFQSKTTDPWVGRSFIDSAPMKAPMPGLNKVLSLQTVKGNGYAGLVNTGYDAVWMQSKFMPSANTMLVQFDALNVKGGERLAPIIYVAQAEPDTLYQFQLLGTPLGDGPQHLQFEVSLKEIMSSGSELPVVVAIGFVNLDRLTTDQAAGIDNVMVTMYDR